MNYKTVHLVLRNHEGDYNRFQLACKANKEDVLHNAMIDLSVIDCEECKQTPHYDRAIANDFVKRAGI
jgi:hypothetical protein